MMFSARIVDNVHLDLRQAVFLLQVNVPPAKEPGIEPVSSPRIGCAGSHEPLHAVTGCSHVRGLQRRPYAVSELWPLRMQAM
jgi:hypothetical protein